MAWQKTKGGWCGGGIRIPDPGHATIPRWNEGQQEWEPKTLYEVRDDLLSGNSLWEDLNAELLNGHDWEFFQPKHQNLQGLSNLSHCGLIRITDQGLFAGVKVVGGTGIKVENGTGCDGDVNVSVEPGTYQEQNDNLTVLSEFNSCGIIATDDNGDIQQLTIEGSDMIAVTNGSGCGGNPSISLSVGLCRVVLETNSVPIQSSASLFKDSTYSGSSWESTMTIGTGVVHTGSTGNFQVEEGIWDFGGLLVLRGVGSVNGEGEPLPTVAGTVGVTVLVQQSTDPDGLNPVPSGIQEFNYEVPAGFPISVPISGFFKLQTRAYLSVLVTAVPRDTNESDGFWVEVGSAFSVRRIG